MTLLIGAPKAQYFDPSTGQPLAGGKIYSYVGGSVSTNKATYPTMPDALDGTNPNTNPITLDARGEADIVVNGSTKLVLYDAAIEDGGTLIWSVDYLDGLDSSRVSVNGDTVITLLNNDDYVNSWTIANSATEQPLIISATGSDTNIVGSLTSKGSGALKLDGGSTGVLELNSASGGNINLRRATTAHSTLAVTGALTAASTAAITGNTTVGGTLVVTGAATVASINIIPPGMVMWYAGSSVPTGWLECTGDAVSRTTYVDLFTAIGTTFGVGDGSTTFTLPNQARRVLVGRGGSSSGTLGSTLGSTGGTETQTLTEANLPAHTHDYTRPALVNAGTASGSSIAAGNYTLATSTSTGSGTAHNIMQPSLVLILLIKT